MQKIEDDDEDWVGYLRVCFKVYDSNLEIIKKMGLLTGLKVLITKLFTSPFLYTGNVYDHVEVLIPEKKSRFSVCYQSGDTEDDDFGLNPKSGVYLRNKNNMSDMFNESMETGRYRLIIVFKINENQKKIMDEFIKTRIGEDYSSNIATFNYLMKSLSKISFGITENLIVNDFENKKRKNGNKRWDCVTLIMRLLREMDVLPEMRKDGSKIKLLGNSVNDFAKLVIDMYEKNELINANHIISIEKLGKTPEGKLKYKRMLRKFYEEECKNFDIKKFKLE